MKVLLYPIYPRFLSVGKAQALFTPVGFNVLFIKNEAFVVLFYTYDKLGKAV